jgi:hypothetical protein
LALFFLKGQIIGLALEGISNWHDFEGDKEEFLDLDGGKVDGGMNGERGNGLYCRVTQIKIDSSGMELVGVGEGESNK